jgi:hypothetical protein
MRQLTKKKFKQHGAIKQVTDRDDTNRIDAGIGGTCIPTEKILEGSRLCL